MTTTVGSNNITFNDGSVQSTAALCIGVDQTWQDVTASRAVSTSYTNSTGKPIMVSVNTQSSTVGATTIQATVSGVVAAQTAIYGSGTGYQANVTFIVPNGASYSVVTGGSGGGTLNYWAELR